MPDKPIHGMACLTLRKRGPLRGKQDVVGSSDGQISNQISQSNLISSNRMFTAQIESLKRLIKSRFKSQSRLAFAHHW